MPENNDTFPIGDNAEELAKAKKLVVELYNKIKDDSNWVPHKDSMESSMKRLRDGVAVDLSDLNDILTRIAEEKCGFVRSSPICASEI
jgi:hypothetical protein